MTNPDMLHLSLLPDHARWADFFFRLSLVVVDEAHVCRGVFGSHVAMVLRRLRRLIAHYGGDPRWVLATATVGNPGELATKLTGLEFDAVVEADAPSGGKLFALWNPPITDEETGTRRSALSEASWMLTRLAEDGVPSIGFTRSRRAAELLAEFTRRSLPPALRDRVKAYRAGYLPEERRKLERQLQDGELLVVAATNALELGIDIGGLDAAVLTGYPGTRASMWQQAGRAGRREGGSLAVLVAQDDPLDQYLVLHPEDCSTSRPRPPSSTRRIRTCWSRTCGARRASSRCPPRRSPPSSGPRPSRPASVWWRPATWSSAGACCTTTAPPTPIARSTSAPAPGTSSAS